MMTQERFAELNDMSVPTDELPKMTPEEVAAGYHYCFEWDGLLVGPEMEEALPCHCWQEGTPQAALFNAARPGHQEELDKFMEGYGDEMVDTGAMISEAMADTMAQRESADTPGYVPYFPPPGAKLTYKGTHPFWFTNMVADAEKKLVMGQVYTLKERQINSSWVKVTLEEVEGDYSLGFFNFPHPLDGTLK